MLQESWDELKKQSNHHCDCAFCLTAIQIAERAIAHVLRETTSNEVDIFIEELLDPSYKPLKKKDLGEK